MGVKVATRAQKARVRVGLAVKALARALEMQTDGAWVTKVEGWVAKAVVMVCGKTLMKATQKVDLAKMEAKALATPCKEATEKVSTTWAAMVANAVLTAKDSERVKEATMIGEVRRETLSSFPNVACDQLIFL